METEGVCVYTCVHVCVCVCVTDPGQLFIYWRRHGDGEGCVCVCVHVCVYV